MNTITYAQQLIRCPSITPLEAETLNLVEEWLKPFGFIFHRLCFGDTQNLYARLGTTSPHFCFLGHTDVVSVIDETKWTYPPFEAEIHDHKLYGRGAVDMKGGIAAFLTASIKYLSHCPLKGSLSVLLTTDEEGPALDGVIEVVEWLKEKKEKIDFCLVGEPTSVTYTTDMIKIGRRGSLNAHLTITGQEGHVAYPSLAKNPILPLLHFIHNLIQIPLDNGYPYFEPTHLEITSIDVGNPTCNIIPHQAQTRFNIRFNPHHNQESLKQWIQDKVKTLPLPYTLTFTGAGEAFLCENLLLQNLVLKAIEENTGLIAKISTKGGTSDARFIKDLCPVIECGLVNTMAHRIDEYVPLDDLERLEQIYFSILKRFFQ